MAEQAGGVEIPHEKIVQALSDRYARALAELHQECAQLQAGLEVAVGERDAALQANRVLEARPKVEPMEDFRRPRPIKDNPQA